MNECRLRELAIEGAFRRHIDNSHPYAFDECMEPDCVLVREPVDPPPPRFWPELCDEESVERFIRSIRWSADATDTEKLLVAGNLRNFAFHIRRCPARDKIGQCELERGHESQGWSHTNARGQAFTVPEDRPIDRPPSVDPPPQGADATQKPGVLPVESQKWHITINESCCPTCGSLLAESTRAQKP